MNNYLNNHNWKDEFNFINESSCNKLTKKAIFNETKNRYSNILPYDDTIVNLPDNKYINASWINNQYIATQGPLPDTIDDFWDMIWHTNCKTIIMLTSLEEKGKVKCENYWNLSNIVSKETITKDIIIRELTVHKNNEYRVITQYHYLKWSDFECPSVKSFIKLLNCITPYNIPLCIHCSAGVGRTGVLVTILTLMNNHEKNLVETIIQLREYRMKLVQTKEQLAFCHKIISYLNM